MCCALRCAQFSLDSTYNRDKHQHRSTVAGNDVDELRTNQKVSKEAGTPGLRLVMHIFEQQLTRRRTLKVRVCVIGCGNQIDVINRRNVPREIKPWHVPDEFRTKRYNM